MTTIRPIQIEVGEWWYKGCFIQRQTHPKLKPYHVFKDTETQETIGDCFSFNEAKNLCELNGVKEYKYGSNSFLK
jgi:hypothetical protein